MADAVAISRGGRRTFLKWHRARRRADDPVFTGSRILEGMALGASIEVDLVLHADHGFAVLHDLTLERETTGTGRVRATPAAVLRTLHLRDNAGTPTSHPVMLLEDLTDLIVRGGTHPAALLQLDFKEDAAALTAAAAATFRRAVAPVVSQVILSAGDAEAVRRLAAGTDGLRLGYDPCHPGVAERLMASRAWRPFVAEALADAPEAELIYLAHELVLLADDDGFDLVGAFHAHGRRVDAYTIRRADAGGLAAADRLLELGVDQITTDDPEGLGAALGRFLR